MTNKSCKLYESEYCRLLNMNSCEGCPFGNVKFEEEAAEIRKDLDTMMDLIPEEGLAPLFCSDTCLLCKDQPRKTSCYAVTDIGHPEPERIKRNFLGLKTRCTVGSMVPVQIACCSRCRRNFRLLEFAPIAVMLTVPIVVLLLLAIRGIHRPLAQISQLLPAGVFVLSVGLGWLLGRMVRSNIRKRKGAQTEFDVWQLPLMKRLRAIGWTSITEDKQGTRLVFSEKRLARGAFTHPDSRGRAK